VASEYSRFASNKPQKLTRINSSKAFRQAVCMCTRADSGNKQTVLYFADFQLRLLLGRPQAQYIHEGMRGEIPMLWWSCGCAAAEVSPKRYGLIPCAEDEDAFASISEQTEIGHYETLSTNRDRSVVNYWRLSQRL
jgi:hypothetical protein